MPYIANLGRGPLENNLPLLTHSRGSIYTLLLMLMSALFSTDIEHFP